MKRPCTCQPPPAVNLTQEFRQLHETNNKKKSSNQRRLLDNLEQSGWSLIEIDVSEISPTEDAFGDILKSHATWKESLVQHFQQQQQQQTTTRNVVYRQAESGAPGTVEPKESWEMQRCSCCGKEEVQTSVFEQRLQTFVDLLHSIAKLVVHVLDLPSNVLLQESDCTNNAPSSSCSVDLLRVFYYDTVHDSNDATTNIMGSSPHTDWGSFTVVWQDTVGGLQTYCHACNKWVNVPTSSSSSCNNDVVSFVLHVGDVTSLAIGRALLLQQTKESKNDDDDETRGVVWPSPRHRVLSPTTAKRVSLVYFAYPPPSNSILGITKALTDWCGKQQQEAPSIRVPYEDYYLLQNQSNDATRTLAPKQVFDSIVDKPLQQVFEEKWQQVQRG